MNPELYESLAVALANAGSVSSPAELHGYVAGSCCAADAPEPVTLCQQLAGHLDISPEQLASAVDLGEWISHIEAGLASPELGFYPLLPDDEESLEQRVVALGQWCEGFLAGYALRVGSSGQTPNAETQEILADLVAISRIGVPDDGDDEETDFMEVVEYLRMAAMSLFIEAREAPASEHDDKPSIH
ncbi:MAG: hypothetical protein EP312_01115 [Gammaproteobacteria bacterium]|nr:MAG: hypothetical protein EP312_01115 [Gammaproteobacteria bacterium]